MTEQKYNIGNGYEMSVEYDDCGIAKITRELFESLIEKQISKEPDMYVTKFPHCCNVSKCPTCGQEFGFNDDFNYCPKCGSDDLDRFCDGTAKCCECGCKFGVVEDDE